MTHGNFGWHISPLDLFEEARPFDAGSGLGIYYRVAATNAEQKSAGYSFAILSMGSFAAVLEGGLVDPSQRE